MSKNDPRPTAYGEVDEAQSAIGVARAALRAETHESVEAAALADHLKSVQRDLYVLMAELATGQENRGRLVPGSSMVTAEMVARIEALIDDAVARFEMPEEFVLPGEELVAAQLDVARCVVRRAERAALEVADDETHVLAYLNRLSDLLWALARLREAETSGGSSAARPPD